VACQVGWAEAARQGQDLSATADCIARDSARYASRFTRNDFAALETLAEFMHTVRERGVVNPHSGHDLNPQPSPWHRFAPAADDLQSRCPGESSNWQ
jgi:plasmid stabilization system protein ParE